MSTLWSNLVLPEAFELLDALVERNGIRRHLLEVVFVTLAAKTHA
jgi:hypothetical protein